MTIDELARELVALTADEVSALDRALMRRGFASYSGGRVLRITIPDSPDGCFDCPLSRWRDTGPNTNALFCVYFRQRDPLVRLQPWPECVNGGFHG